VFSVGTNPNGPTKNIGGRIGHPVTVGGVTVRAGDFITGDGDGVLVVEREKIESLLGAARKKVVDEAKRIAAIQQGQTAQSQIGIEQQIAPRHGLHLIPFSPHRQIRWSSAGRGKGCPPSLQTV